MALIEARLRSQQGRAGLPILYLDATLPERNVRYFLPRLDVLANVQAVAPHMHVEQVIGNFGKSSLVPNKKTTDQVADWRTNLLSEIRDFVTLNGGGNWINVTPPALTPWSKVTQIEASHFDADTAYVSVSRLRIDDLHPYIYRTRDRGKSWQPIVSGLPANAPVNAVRATSFSSAGNKAVLKYAQNQATKNITSEAMNKIMP